MTGATRVLAVATGIVLMVPHILGCRYSASVDEAASTFLPAPPIGTLRSTVILRGGQGPNATFSPQGGFAIDSSRLLLSDAARRELWLWHIGTVAAWRPVQIPPARPFAPETFAWSGRGRIVGTFVSGRLDVIDTIHWRGSIRSAPSLTVWGNDRAGPIGPGFHDGEVIIAPAAGSEFVVADPGMSWDDRGSRATLLRLTQTDTVATGPIEPLNHPLSRATAYAAWTFIAGRLGDTLLTVRARDGTVALWTQATLDRGTPTRTRQLPRLFIPNAQPAIGTGFHQMDVRSATVDACGSLWVLRRRGYEWSTPSGPHRDGSWRVDSMVVEQYIHIDDDPAARATVAGNWRWIVSPRCGAAVIGRMPLHDGDPSLLMLTVVR